MQSQAQSDSLYYMTGQSSTAANEPPYQQPMAQMVNQNYIIDQAHAAYQ